MAETESNVSGEAQLSDGDDLSETNLGSVRAQGNSVDYVERGCGFSVDHGANTIDIGNTNTRGNYAIVEEPSPHVAWDLFPDQATGISLPDTNGTNHVYIAYNTSTDQIFYHIDDDDTAPSEPALKIGTVDTGNDTSTELNREPSAGVRLLTVDDTSADPSANGEITRNGTDVKAFTGGVVKSLSDIGSGGGGGTPGGSNTQIQYNNSGSFGGIADFTYDGTNLTDTPDLDTKLVLLDQATDPSANGEIQLNGADIKAFSGGAVRNLSAVTDADLAVDPFVYDAGMTEWETGLTNEEVNRINLEAGEALVVERIEYQQKGGGFNTAANVSVFDADAGTKIGEAELGNVTKDAGTSGAGNNVTVRVSNSVGSTINATARVQGWITGV